MKYRAIAEYRIGDGLTSGVRDHAKTVTINAPNRSAGRRLAIDRIYEIERGECCHVRVVSIEAVTA